MENSEPAEETAGEKVEEAIVETTTETQDEANTTPEEPVAQTE
jgi:hypothetical protein